jgi:hypothetical protein
VTAGFDHFDGSSRETFAAALVLLCLEEDPSFRAAISKLVRSGAGKSEASALVEWGREEHLDTGTDQKRRCDIWLRFEDGIILVEIKTHSGWNPASVQQQLAVQRTSSLGGERVLDAILLAPGFLLRRLSAAKLPQISWHDFLHAVAAIEHPSQIVRLAEAHWSQNVERDFGLSASVEVMPLQAVAIQTGCLIAFLRAAIVRLGGTARSTDAVWFSSPDGRPGQLQQWAWVGVAVAGKLPGVGDVYAGIYSYSAAPPGGALGTFVEVYKKGDDYVPLASVPFAPSNLSSETLHSILSELDDAYASSRKNTVQQGNGG